jgi:hypothetical protein
MYYETMRIGSKYSINRSEDSLTIVRMVDGYFEKIHINKDGYVNITVSKMGLRFYYPQHLTALMIGEVSEIIEYESKRYVRDSMLIERINRIMYDLIKYYESIQDMQTINC